jgi:phosphoribosyl 1,2-cyclic phosphodiesterase
VTEELVMPEPAFTITYWGVTGTLTAPLRGAEVTDKVEKAIIHLTEQGRLADLKPGPDLAAAVRRAVESLPFHLRTSYGGNTTCVEVQTPDALLIFDCGSGFRELGVALEARWRAAGKAAVRKADVIVTHAHMDHTFATPYFVPYYNPANSFNIWGSQVVIDSLAAVLNPQSSLSQIYFPPTYDQMKAIKEFRTLLPGQEFHIGSTRLRTYALHHPGGCLAFRLENAGRSFVFATDHEQQHVPDAGLAEFARGADLLYTEGQYTKDEYEGRTGICGDPPASRHGWGHSPIESCVVTAVAAGVKALHVGHRDPRRGDADLADLDAFTHRVVDEELRRVGRPAGACQAQVAYEGMTVRL